MRVPPWLDPRVCPGSNCSRSTTSTPRRASHHAVAEPMAPAPTTITSTFFPLISGIRYVLPNIHSVSRIVNDLPPVASDQELLDWANELLHGTPATAERVQPAGRAVVRDERRLYAEKYGDRLTLEELLLDIESRATEVYERAHA